MVKVYRTPVAGQGRVGKTVDNCNSFWKFECNSFLIVRGISKCPPFERVINYVCCKIHKVWNLSIMWFCSYDDLKMSVQMLQLSHGCGAVVTGLWDRCNTIITIKYRTVENGDNCNSVFWKWSKTRFVRAVSWLL